jgi:hypothetical protein
MQVKGMRGVRGGAGGLGREQSVCSPPANVSSTCWDQLSKVAPPGDQETPATLLISPLALDLL